MVLGRKAVKTNSRTLRLGNYLTRALPPPPPACDWTNGIRSWGVMLNHRLKNCTIAGAAHAVQVWTAHSGSMVTIPDATIESYYEKWDSYDPADPRSDTGGIELDVLNKWKKQGFAGHALLAFADPEISNLVEIRQSIALFGGVYIGMAMPKTAKTQERVWDVVQDGGHKANRHSWGGHCVFVPKYDEESFTCITWGKLMRITLPFWEKYCDEAHTLLSQNWLDKNHSPAGFNQAQLLADLKAIK